MGIVGYVFLGDNCCVECIQQLYEDYELNIDLAIDDAEVRDKHGLPLGLVNDCSERILPILTKDAVVSCVDCGKVLSLIEKG